MTLSKEESSVLMLEISAEEAIVAYPVAQVVKPRPGSPSAQRELMFLAWRQLVLPS